MTRSSLEQAVAATMKTAYGDVGDLPGVAQAAVSRYRRRRRRRLTVGAIGTVAVLVAAAFGTNLFRQGSRNPVSAAFADRILKSGDVVAATGTALIRAGQSPRLCLSAENSSGGTASFSCEAAIGLSKVDEARLGNPHKVGSMLLGDATFTGVWRGRSIDVSGQTAALSVAPPGLRVTDLRNFVNPPCRRPKGGWVLGGPPDWSALAAYERANPDRVLSDSVFRPVAGALVDVIAVTDLASVPHALSVRYGSRLCVVQSRYTPAALRTSRARVASLQGSADVLPEGIYAIPPTGGLGLSQANGQPVIEVDVISVTKQIESIVSRAPAGLVKVYPAVRKASG